MIGRRVMNHSILWNNQKKRLDQPLWMLVCFAMFCFWQMGFIYYMGPSLNIDGRTPLPISMDNITALIALSYVLSIAWMYFLPQFVIWTQRIVTMTALATAVGLFLPLAEEILRVLIYAQVFLCCFMIGFETFIMVNFFSEDSNIRHLTAAYGISELMVAAVQNDFVPITFTVFRVLTVLAIVMLLTFLWCMPADKKALPQYVKKKDGLRAPKKLLLGAYLLVFVGAMMGVSGPAISGEVRHGVFVTYLVNALASLGLYLLYKKANIHPFRMIPVCMGLGCMGFLLMYVVSYVPGLALVACGFIGAGMVPCGMLPLYGSVLMKSYPSKSIPPIIIGLALVAVLVQGSMVEVFRGAPAMLNLTYGVIMVVLVTLYLQIEPFFLFALRRRITDDELAADLAADTKGKTEVEEAVAEADGGAEAAALHGSVAEIDPLQALSKREREVADLICMGYSNADIAKILCISEHTVKDHTKKIYPKMGVHSRFELAALVSNGKTKEAKV